ncbi:chromosomal replication initiator DnaA [uncultured Roseobacter sp.]|uniref:HdaA/DnaA family protein n=1 Tax=uncultured Roseobacter sp. TaxID=114847 RepID=UPI002603FF7C|nr:chromosomal replication initiator DnaA [uncultured Roseobacter sp.]
MPEQLSFDLPSVPALGRADFMVAPSNAVAVAMIEAAPAGKLVLTGPEGSGKTHLAHVWATKAKAKIISSLDLNEADIPVLAQRSIVVEDVPEIAGDADQQNALFHLHNLVLAEDKALLLTGRGAVRDWGITLPDLASRVAAAPSASLELPDDTLLAAILAKLFADRQLTPKRDLIPYLITRMDRSFAAARDLVDRLDTASLAQKRPISRVLAASLLDNEVKSAR